MATPRGGPFDGSIFDSAIFDTDTTTRIATRNPKDYRDNRYIAARPSKR